MLAYGIAVAVTIAANGLGLYALWKNGVSHDISFSGIVCSTNSVCLSAMKARERIGALPLSEDIAQMRLAFSSGDSAYGFAAVERDHQR